MHIEPATGYSVTITTPDGKTVDRSWRSPDPLAAETHAAHLREAAKRAGWNVKVRVVAAEVDR